MILRSLLFVPGELAVAFREGRTQRYVPALRLYLFVSLIFFVLLAISNIALMQFEVTVQPHVNVQEVVRKAIAEGMDAKDAAELRRTIEAAHRDAHAMQIQSNTPNEDFSGRQRELLLEELLRRGARPGVGHFEERGDAPFGAGPTGRVQVFLVR